MGVLESLPERPLQFEEVEELDESDTLSLTPVSMVMETGLVHSVLLAPNGSELHVGVGFNPEDEQWVEVGRVNSNEEMQSLWKEVEIWANETYSGEHRMGEANLDSGDVEWDDEKQE